MILPVPASTTSPHLPHPTTTSTLFCVWASPHSFVLQVGEGIGGEACALTAKTLSQFPVPSYFVKAVFLLLSHRGWGRHSEVWRSFGYPAKKGPNICSTVTGLRTGFMCPILELIFIFSRPQPGH